MDNIFTLNLRFNSTEIQLSDTSGIPISQLGELLVQLSKALDIKTNDITLSKIKGNCYAISLSTHNEPTYVSMRNLHRDISENNTGDFDAKKRDYLFCLNKVMGNKLKMNVYDDDKTFDYDILPQTDIVKQVFYYIQEDVSGIITDIGSKSLTSPARIKLDKIGFDIIINSEQEKKLIGFYKINKLRLTINKKMDFYNDKLINAELLDFSVLNNEMSFINKYKQILEETKGIDIFEEVKDSVDSVRKLRGNID